MDPITGTLILVATALLESGVSIAVTAGLNEKVLKQNLSKEASDARQKAIEQTISSSNPENAKRIIDSLEKSVKPETRELFASELRKLLILSESPDVATLAKTSFKHVNYRISDEYSIIDIDTITLVITLFLDNLRNQLLDQPTYGELFTNRESIRITREQLSIAEQSLGVQREMLDVMKDMQSSMAISKPSKQRKDFYRHRNFPPVHYVARPELIQTVLEKIIENDSQITILHGMGGLGKSVSARAICQEETLNNLFTDAIIFIELGKTPNLVQILHNLIEHFGGKAISSNLQVLKNKLANILTDQRVLLIIDDVWQYQDVQLFNVVQSTSKILITTRDRSIANRLGASVIEIPLMNQDEGIELLDKWRDNAKPEQNSTKINLLSRLGFHPQAIMLAGAQLAQKNSPTIEEWLQNFDARKLEFDIIDEHTDSLRLTFELSLELLSEPERKLYSYLSIFPYNQAIPKIVVRNIWSQFKEFKSFDIGTVLVKLQSIALLSIGGTRSQTINIHSLMREFLQYELDSDAISDIHQSIVDYYKEQRVDDNWDSVAPDGYYYEYLSYHLAKSNNNDELYALLVDTPDWWRAKLRHSGHFASYIDDINLALSTFSQPISTEQLGIVIQLYAAKETVQKSISSYIDEELRAMVWLDKIAEAERVAWQHSEPYYRFKAIFAIQKALKQRGMSYMDLHQCLSLVNKIPIIEYKVQSLCSTIEFYWTELKDEQKSSLWDQIVSTAKEEAYNNKRIANNVTIITLQLQLDEVNRAKTLFDDTISNNAHDKIPVYLLAKLLELNYDLNGSDNVQASLLTTIEDSLDEQHDETLANLATSLIRVNLPEKAEKVLGYIEGAYSKIVALSNMAVASHKKKQEDLADQYFSRAFNFIQTEALEDSLSHGESSLYRLVANLAQAERFYQAANIVYSMRYLHWRGLALSSLIGQLAHIGQVADARLHYLSRGDCKLEKHSVVKLGLEVAKQGYIDLAETLIIKKTKAVPADWDLTNKLFPLVRFLLDEGDVKKAHQLTESIPENNRRVQSYQQIIWKMLENENIEEARALCLIAEGELEPNNNSYVEALTSIVLCYALLDDFDKAKELYARAVNHTLNYPIEYGRCSKLSTLLEFSYKLKDTELNFWKTHYEILTKDVICLDSIFTDLAGIVDIQDNELISLMLHHNYTYDHSRSGVYYQLAERAIVENPELLQKIYSIVENVPNPNDEQIALLVRLLVLKGNFAEALEKTKEILSIELRCNQQIHIAAIMLRNDDEAFGRSVFERAKQQIISIEAYGQTEYAASYWSEELFNKGYWLEALDEFQVSAGSDYTEILDHYEKALSEIDPSLFKMLFFRIARIYAWVDSGWETALNYLDEVNGKKYM